jgi:hypothetical protein
VEVIHVSPRTENCEEDSTARGEEVPVQESHHEERRRSDRKRMELSFLKPVRALADEKWHHNKDSLEGREVEVPRKHQSSDSKGRYEDSAVGDKDVEIPIMRVHYAQDNDDDEGRMLISRFINKVSFIYLFECHV